MTRRIVVLETKWYLAYQDGPASNETYDTESEANAALAALRKKGQGYDICVMSRTQEVEP